ncbi:MAG: carbonic anhydrase [Rhizobiales bacterium]|nr:carbonic anhydrase [Hyphomicrobiales bacterium]
MTFPQRLIDGYNAFSAGRLPQEQDRYRVLAEHGQSPEIMVIGCCDSRVSPEVIFDARPGELFVVRNVGNLVPPYTPDGAQRAVSAALEFAVQALKVKHIVVLGHAQCGGIRAFAEEAAPLSPGDFIGRWMSLIAPAAKTVGPRDGMPLADYLTKLEQASVVQMLDNLMTFPCVSILVERHKLTLHAAYFGVATGELSVLDRTSGKFMRIGTAEHAG